MTNRWTAVSLAGLALAFGGCGGSGSHLNIEGTVSVDSQPVEKGTISFTPLKSGAGESVSAEILVGKYQARRVPLGQTRVQFHAVKETGKMVTTADPAEGGTHPEVINLIPVNYRDGIKIDLRTSDKTQDFNLTSR